MDFFNVFTVPMTASGEAGSPTRTGELPNKRASAPSARWRFIRRMVCLLVFLFGMMASADAAVVAQEAWKATYDNYVGGSSEFALKVVRDGNGDVIIIGYAYRANNYDMLTVKVSGTTGTKLWAQRNDEPANRVDFAQAVAVDANGDVFVTGYSYNGANNDYYTAKYSGATGTLLWQQLYNGGFDDRTWAMAVDGNGDVFVTGYSSDGSHADYYTVKYAGATGAVLWGSRYNGGSTDVAQAMAVDGNGDVFVTGYSHQNGSYEDYYTVKYAGATGAVLWNSRYNGGSYDIAQAMAVDGNGDVFVTGYSYNGSNQDYYTVKYAGATGAVLWGSRSNGGSHDVAQAMAVDGNGNVFVTGYSYNASNEDYYTVKYAGATGAVLWGSRYNGGLTDVARAIAVDGNGDVFVTGHSHNGSYDDYYTVKYAGATGAVLWGSRYNGGLTDNARAMAVDGNGDVFVTGYSHNGSNDDYYTVKYRAADGTQLWESRYDGPVNRLDELRGAAMDANGNVVVTGMSDNGSNKDFYTAKYARSTGQLLWERRYNGVANGDDIPNVIAVDGDGNVIVTGSSRNNGFWDFYTAKYAAADGALLWEEHYDNAGDDVPNSIAVDGSGNVYVTGSSFDSATGHDHFTVKYPAAGGVPIWTRRYDAGNSGGNDYGKAVAIDASGNAIVTGYSVGASGGYDFYTAKYAAADGSTVWEQRYNGGFDDFPQAMAVDGNGDVIVTGTSHNGSSAESYTLKYAGATGTLLWDSRYNFGFADVPQAIAVDGNGQVFVTGYSANGSNYDYYTVNYAAADGATLWTKRYNSGVGSATDEARAIAVDASGNVVVTGRSWGPSANLLDFYTAKYAAGNGDLIWEKRYAGPGHSISDEAVAVLVDPIDGGTVVAGTSDQNFLTIRYVENLPPVILCPADIQVQVTELAGGVVNFAATATDDSGLPPSIVCVPASGSVFPVGDTTVTCTATDNLGASSSCSFLVTVTALREFQVGTMPFVVVDHANNTADPWTGFGAVAYPFSIGKYEVTLNEYTAFLNAVAAEDPTGLYAPELATTLTVAGIQRSGASGSFTYSAIGNGQRPVTFVTWFNAARYANWMHNGRPTGPQNAATTEDGAYTLNGATSGLGFSKNSTARFWIPSEDEWYKAAYYQPFSEGGDTDDYWLFPTRSNVRPNSRNGSITDPNSANFYWYDGVVNGVNDGFAVSGSTTFSESDSYLTPVGAFEKARSHFHTFDQGGNVWEWHDGIFSGGRGLRGGAWGDIAATTQLQSDYQNGIAPDYRSQGTGFRLATLGTLHLQPPPNMLVLGCSPGGVTPVNYSLTVIGLAPVVNCTPPSGSDFSPGVTTVNCSGTDAFGNAASCSFTVTVESCPAPPVVTCPADMVVISTSYPNVCGEVVNFSASVTDDCSSPVLTCVPPSGSVFPLGVTTVTCTAVNQCGNSASDSFEVTVLEPASGDFFEPCWRGLAGSTFQHWMFSRSDTTVSPELVSNGGSPEASVVLGGLAYGWVDAEEGIGCRQGYWDLGAGGTVTFTVPEAVAPAGSYRYVRLQTLTFRDGVAYVDDIARAVPGAVLVSQSEEVREITLVGDWVVNVSLWRLPNTPATTSVTLTAPATSALLDQVVVETFAMTPAVCPADIILPTDGSSCERSGVTWSLPDVDGCRVRSIVCLANGLPVTQPATFPIGVTTVSCDITDAEGAVQNCAFTVTIRDGGGPEFVHCATPQVVAADPLLCSAVVPDFVAETVVTDCSPLTVTQDPVPGTVVEIGTHAVLIHANDGFGNLRTCRTTFTVTDATPPVVVAGAPPQFADASSETCTAPLPDFTTTLDVADCNGPVLITQDIAPGTAMPLGTHTITLTARDQANLTVNIVTQFHVSDRTPPVITVCPLARTVDLTETCYAHLPDLRPEVAAEDCNGIQVIFQNPSHGALLGVGVHPVIFRVLDRAGNQTTCTTTFTVRDIAPPVIGLVTATEMHGATEFDVLNCARHVFPGVVRFTVAVSDQCPMAPGTVTLVNGANTESAVLVSQIPAGPSTALTCTYEWTVTTATPEGAWTATVAVSDSGATTTANYPLCVTRPRINGEVQLQGFIGTVTPTRAVTFVATSAGGAVLKTWTEPVLFAGPEMKGSFTLVDVPLDTAFVSAKTAWNKRRKCPVSLGSDNTAVLDITGGSRELLAGDVTGDNIVNFGDYLVLAARFLRTVSDASDPDNAANLNGDDSVNLLDYVLLGLNWFSVGEAE